MSQVGIRMSGWRLVFGAVTLFPAVGLLSANAAGAEERETLRVMTFNMWYGGEAGKQPLDQSVQVIQAGQADLVGLQETRGEEKNGQRPDNARRMAERLQWHYLDQGDNRGIISRHKIIAQTPLKLGACIELPSGRRVWHFNIHFAHAPYQPYQLLKIPYADAPFIDTAEQAVAAALEARGTQVAALLNEIETIGEDANVLITGDFNEPCVLDWTDAVYSAGRCPVPVAWPTTASVVDAGFVDAYREIYEEPLQQPGYTWTPITSEDDPRDRHDRIDLVFVRGESARIERAEIIGEREVAADLVVTPYPSDHRAVVITIRFSPRS